MKNGKFIRGLAALAAGALLLPTAASAQTTSFTGDGWLDGVPVPGVFTTSGLGQVMLRGNVHTIAFQGSDPRGRAWISSSWT